MLFKCKNCGGNVVYDPVSHKMICISCNATDSEELITQTDTHSCAACGAQLPLADYTSATKCAYCGANVIVDDKIKYPYGPDVVIPFSINHDGAADLLRKEFQKGLFLPGDFLREKTMEQLVGEYVPFWLYDYHTMVHYDGVGTKVRSWTTGSTEYTETSRYHVARELEIDFKRIPADASIAMDDKVMDLMEPYDYSKFDQFDSRYLSGFTSETYNFTPDQLETRARTKADTDARSWLNSTMSGYTSNMPQSSNIEHQRIGNEFALMPVWKYVYRYKNKEYPFYVNGQTGKIYGSAPKSGGKIASYSGIIFVVTLLFMKALQMLLEVI